jgi:hypothetical protein
LSLNALLPDRSKTSHVDESQDDDNQTCHHHYHPLQEVGPYDSLYSTLKYQTRTVFTISTYVDQFWKWKTTL